MHQFDMIKCDKNYAQYEIYLNFDIMFWEFMFEKYISKIKFLSPLISLLVKMDFYTKCKAETLVIFWFSLSMMCYSQSEDCILKVDFILDA